MKPKHIIFASAVLALSACGKKPSEQETKSAMSVPIVCDANGGLALVTIRRESDGSYTRKNYCDDGSVIGNDGKIEEGPTKGNKP